MVDATWLSGARGVAIEAPAGTGKTTLISSSVALSHGGCQLVLTHTHAGVGAIHRALKKKSVPGAQCHVDTIAGWALRYARSYPGLSGMTVTEPKKEEWEEVYRGALKLLENRVIRRVIKESYAGLYVDEYQDCTAAQHALIVALAEVLPCRVLGDPLQGIFEFVKSGIVDWVKDVGSCFDLHPGPDFPWRWEGKNPELGSWLSKVRRALILGEPIDLQQGPITWKPLDGGPVRQTQINATKYLRLAPGESVIAIDKWADGVNKMAGSLGGTYSSIESIECPELFKHADQIQKTTGLARAVAVIDFASQCMTKTGTHLSSIRLQFIAGRVPISRKAQEELTALLAVAKSSEVGPVLNALTVLSKIPGAALYRRELFNEMRRALANCDSRVDLTQSAWKTRNVTRQIGRSLPSRSVGTTLLIKGLEFDHAIILDAEKVGDTRKHLYVALTRGSRSLTVLSRSPIISFS